MAIDTTTLFCCLDDFCKVYEEWQRHKLIPSGKARQRAGKLSLSEALFIMALFHLSSHKTFKAFYLESIGQRHRACFRELPHHDRFVSLMPRLFAPLMVLLHSLGGEETGIYFADSTKLAVCHSRRASRNKVFEGMAAHGKTSLGKAGPRFRRHSRWNGQTRVVSRPQAAFCGQPQGRGHGAEGHAGQHRRQRRAR